MQMANAILTELDALKSGHTLPGKFYHDADIFKFDMETIWYRDWLFVGHDCEIPKAGNFFTLQLGAYPIVVVRGRDGVIRAFHNSCRHRGSRVCTQESGSKIRLVCPYHQWTYELDGTLMHARDMGEGFDFKAHSLKPVHCESVGGYIWICVAKDAPDFNDFRTRMGPYFAPHNLIDAKVAFSSTMSRRATGNSCGKTIASAITARAAIRNCAARSMMIRASRALARRTATRISSITGTVARPQVYRHSFT